MSLYTHWIRPLFFRLPAEVAHHLALRLLAVTPAPVLRTLFTPRRETSPREVFGVSFPHPVGLAAGMDKDALALPAWEALGFGHVEIGTITARAQPGNPRPRLFRYPEQQALVNRMGFNNAGAEAVALRLSRLRAAGRWPGIPVGINIGKSKTTPLDDAPSDYRHSARLLGLHGDYFVVNVSSPNTPGLRDLQESSRLRDILRAVRAEIPTKPLLVKISPDLENDHARDLLALCAEEGCAGLIATNTTLDHSALPSSRDQQGGLSGAPLRTRSTELLARLAGSLPVIASGGVVDATAAKEKFAAGAPLVQVYTGFVYRGPQIIPEILSHL